MVFQLACLCAVEVVCNDSSPVETHFFCTHWKAMNNTSTVHVFLFTYRARPWECRRRSVLLCPCVFWSQWLIDAELIPSPVHVCLSASTSGSYPGLRIWQWSWKSLLYLCLLSWKLAVIPCGFVFFFFFFRDTAWPTPARPPKFVCTHLIWASGAGRMFKFMHVYSLGLKLMFQQLTYRHRRKKTFNSLPHYRCTDMPSINTARNTPIFQ